MLLHWAVTGLGELFGLGVMIPTPTGVASAFDVGERCQIFGPRHAKPHDPFVWL